MDKVRGFAVGAQLGLVSRATLHGAVKDAGDFSDQGRCRVVRFGLTQVVRLVGLVIVLAVVGACGCSGEEDHPPLATDEPLRTLLPAPKEQPNGCFWGYVDQSGQWMIEPQFEGATRFHEGLAAVKVNGQWGYADEGGNLVIKPQYAEANGFSGGLARVAAGPAPYSDDDWLVTASGYGFIDRSGRVIVALEWDDAGDFSEGLAPVMRDSTCGFIDATGELVIPLQFDSAVSFSDGLACAARNGKWGYIDRQGTWVIAPQYGGLLGFGVADETFGLGAGRFKYGLAPVYIDGGVGGQGGTCQYIDKTGRKAFAQVFFQGGEFSEGLAPVQMGSDSGFMWGFIDVSGVLTIKAEYEFAGAEAGAELYLLSYGGFHGGLAAVAKNGRVGYIDASGNIVIQPQFAVGWGFFDGYAYVMRGESTKTQATSWGYIDAAGHSVY
jgi:hypothetical protein